MEQAQTAGTRMRAALRGQGRYILLAGIIAGEFLLFGVAAPYFLTVGNLFNILRQVSEIGMISIPLTFLLLAAPSPWPCWRESRRARRWASSTD